ncbi:hypothetical protein NDU88_006121 [Pleurodeles waltl]|uniref:Uncharacterized protein n=1 Tax=Pleurodeles waltl TaxID=8319 RepID=A0AAV7SNP0_PLEWA|nr:hypothetical protein NDU88_006121 [Pleurodeles waltl]
MLPEEERTWRRKRTAEGEMVRIRRPKRQRRAAQERKEEQRRNRPTQSDFGEVDGPAASQEGRGLLRYVTTCVVIWCQY